MESKHAVLIVDDEEKILNALRRIFMYEKQCEIFTVTSGKAALAFLEATPIDLVVSDQRMPEMTGTELLKRIKEKDPRVVRVLLSGYSDFEALISAINEGEIYRFISKPWDNQQLLAIIRSALLHKESLDEVDRVAKHLAGMISDAHNVVVTTHRDEQDVHLKIESRHPVNAQEVLPEVFVFLERIGANLALAAHAFVNGGGGSITRTSSGFVLSILAGHDCKLIVELPCSPRVFS
jgi:YesN/AraC family two-component response regulator